MLCIDKVEETSQSLGRYSMQTQANIWQKSSQRVTTISNMDKKYSVKEKP